VHLANEKEAGGVMNDVARAAEIFSLHGNFIRTVIRFRIGDHDLVDDLYNNFFLSLVSRPIPPDVHNIKSYLHRAIINDCFDTTRRIERYQDKIQRYAKYAENSINIAPPENALIEKEETDKLFKLIEEVLPSSESQAVILKYKDDSSIGEVAKEMAVNKRSISKYISVGLKKVRQFVAEKEET
jgi:RNA polymerase sigma factor (sigma-70 family)